MTFASKVNLLVFALVILPGNAFSQSQPEQLSQMVEQLQKTPTDNSLREKIIKLAQTLQPPPAVPDEALRREGRGKFAFRNAKANDDYVAAAKEYEEAVRLAPWINAYYFNLCLAYEKTEDYVAAKRNCELSLIGVTDQSEINETKQRIAGLEFGIEKAAKEKAAAETPEAKDAAFMKSIEGARFVEHRTNKSMGLVSPLDYDEVYEIKNGMLVYSLQVYVINGNAITLRGGISRPGNYEIFRVGRSGGMYYYTFDDGTKQSFKVADDGQSLLETYLSNPTGFPAALPIPGPTTIARKP